MKRYFGYKNSDKEGFTLAEVLITLGIIGVVAAMTVPTLMMNYQRKVWEARLKKTFSVAVNACERMLVEENVSASNETDLYKEQTVDNVKRYFKVLKNPEADPDGKGYLISLPDGADLYFSANASLPGFHFYVDVNGTSRPDEAGRDRFVFDIDKNCTYSASEATDEAKYFKYVVEHNWEIPEEMSGYGIASEPAEPPAEP